MVIASNSDLFGKITIMFVLLLVVNSLAAARTIHVKAGGTGDGSSWANAYGSLQTALDSAEPNDRIWVAAGTYQPGGTPFQMKNGVEIYGGFPDTGDPNSNDRDPRTYSSILHGNNSRVFDNNDLDPNAVLDGFTIKGGIAYYGAGMYNTNSDPTIIDCIFSSNMTYIFGGGMYNINSDPTIINCRFNSNRTYNGSNGKDRYCGVWGSSPPVFCTEPTYGFDAGNGAGMYNKNSSPTLINCTFKGNRTGSGGRGGVGGPENGADGGNGGSGAGVYNYYSSPTLINCGFLDNKTGSGGAGGGGFPCGACGHGGNGAGMFNFNSSPTLINCTFNGNKPASGGHGDMTCFILYDYYISPGIGGGMYNSNSSPVVTNCIFWGNFGGEIYDSYSSPIITYSDIKGGYPGVGNINSQPFSVCSTVYLSRQSACIDAGDNNSLPGYIVTDLEGSPRFIDDPNITDTGNGTSPIVDMGAYEYDPLAEPAPYSGSGTAANPYQIWSGAEFSAIRCHPEDWDNHFRLMNDIDLSDYKGHPIYNIIGYEVPGNSSPFTGVFDGDGHTISGFKYSDFGGPIGLFGYVSGSGAEIKNLGLIEPNVYSPSQGNAGALVGLLDDGAKVAKCYVSGGTVSGDYQVGGLVGLNDNGSIAHCYSTAKVTGSDRFGGLCGGNKGTISDCYASGLVEGDAGAWGLGGLIGSNWQGAIINCYSEGYVIGNNYIGGLCGNNWGGTIAECHSTGNVRGYNSVGGLCGENSDVISKCYATGSVSGNNSVGGLCGSNRKTIANCYATGSVDGNNTVGGLVGYNRLDDIPALITNCFSRSSVTAVQYVGGLVGGNSGTFSNSYSTGVVSGTLNIGGLVGGNSGTITSCFWDVVTSGQSSSAGGTGLPTSLMKTRSTFTNAGWDFVGETINGPNDIWDICEKANYPRFPWQIPLGDFLCPDGVDFFDFSFFAGHWAEVNCGASNDCEGTDFDLLGTVDIYDLRIFVDNWLTDLISPPGQASDPNPPAGAVDVNLFSDLSWTAGAGATSHDVYFGTSNPPAFQGNQPYTVFDPGKLDSDTTYYWRIDSVNKKWGKTTGKVWSFTTVIDIYKATNPSPPDGSTISNLDYDLSWTAGAAAYYHEVYFGTSNPPPFIQNQFATTYDPGTMTPLTKYYWSIVEVNPYPLGKTPGDLWSFTTMMPPPPP